MFSDATLKIIFVFVVKKDLVECKSAFFLDMNVFLLRIMSRNFNANELFKARRRKRFHDFAELQSTNNPGHTPGGITPRGDSPI